MQRLQQPIASYDGSIINMSALPTFSSSALSQPPFSNQYAQPQYLHSATRHLAGDDPQTTSSRSETVSDKRRRKKTDKDKGGCRPNRFRSDDDRDGSGGGSGGAGSRGGGNGGGGGRASAPGHGLTGGQHYDASGQKG